MAALPGSIPARCLQGTEIQGRLAVEAAVERLEIRIFIQDMGALRPEQQQPRQLPQ